MWIWMVLAGCAGGADDTGAELEAGMEGEVMIDPSEWWGRGEALYVSAGVEDVLEWETEGGELRMMAPETPTSPGKGLGVGYDATSEGLWVDSRQFLSPTMTVGELVTPDEEGLSVLFAGVEECGGDICLRLEVGDEVHAGHHLEGQWLLQAGEAPAAFTLTLFEGRTWARQ